MNDTQPVQQQSSEGETTNASGLFKEEPHNKQSAEATPKKPKNLQQGLMFGASNILNGAISGLSVAVAAPVMGAKVGAEKRGFVGGAAGLVGGAAVGVIGAAGCLVGGAVKGAVDIKRGVEAVPASISAPRKGKWWNEAISSWVYTDITKLDIPENDDDILKGIEKDLDGIDSNATATDTSTGEVKETYYYDTLEVHPAADASKIKRQYYLMARKFHPDKNPGDAAATEKFKAVAEAYQVLSDPELRVKYDKDGKDGLSGDKTSGNGDQKPDPSLLLAFLFGSDRFNTFVGRLATSTSAMLGDTTELSVQDARTLQERRCSRLAIILANRVKPWVEKNFDEMEGLWKIQAEELVKTSYGWELLQVIGMAYDLAGVQFLGSNDSGIGIPSIKKWAGGKVAATRTAGRKFRNKLATTSAALDLGTVQTAYRQKIEAASSEEEKRQLEMEMGNVSSDVMMRIIWTTTSVDIASTIHETCQMVFFDQSVSKEVREMRAKAVKKLGKIFKECPKPERAEGDRTNAHKLFEEASMAATLETIKRKDEPNHGDF